MRRSTALPLTLIAGALCLAGSYAANTRLGAPQLYASLKLTEGEKRELSLVLTNIGGKEIALPLDGLEVLVRPAVDGDSRTTMHVRAGFGRAGTRRPQPFALLPGDSVTLDGLYRHVESLPGDKAIVYAVFEAAYTGAGQERAWHGLVRSFPVDLRPKR